MTCFLCDYPVSAGFYVTVKGKRYCGWCRYVPMNCCVCGRFVSRAWGRMVVEPATEFAPEERFAYCIEHVGRINE